MCVCGRGSTVLLQMCVLLVRERVCKQVRKTKTVCVTEYYYTCKKERFVAGGLLEQQGRRMHVFVCMCACVCARVCARECVRPPAGVPHVDMSYRARDSSRETNSYSGSMPRERVCMLAMCTCVCEFVTGLPVGGCVMNVLSMYESVSLYMCFFIHSLSMQWIRVGVELTVDTNQRRYHKLKLSITCSG